MHDLCCPTTAKNEQKPNHKLVLLFFAFKVYEHITVAALVLKTVCASLLKDGLDLVRNN